MSDETRIDFSLHDHHTTKKENVFIVLDLHKSSGLTDIRVWEGVLFMCVVRVENCYTPRDFLLL